MHYIDLTFQIGKIEMVANTGWDGTIVLKTVDLCGPTSCCTSILESL
jgi:hypothetical protein